VSALDPLVVGVLCEALFGCFETQVHHVEDDCQVDHQDQDADDVRAAHDVCNFEGDIQGARGYGHPLGPGADIPQSVGLDEAKHYIDGRYQGYLPQAHVADAVDQVDEDAYEVVMRIGVDEFKEALGYSPDISVTHREYAQASEKDYDAFQEFEGGNGAHAFDVSGVTEFGVRDVGMHFGEGDFRDSRV